jgi:uncharacterized protein YjcR
MNIPRLFEMWTAGARVQDIAAAFGVSMSQVSRWKSRYGLPPRARAVLPLTRDPTPEEIETMKRQLREKHYAERRGEA